MTLPPGQSVVTEFARFGLPAYADRFPPADASADVLTVLKDGFAAVDITKVPRTAQRSDFHCVTGWSCVDLQWEGYRFRDIYAAAMGDDAANGPDADHVLIKCHDGFRSILPLEDMLAEDVIIADTLGDAPLTLEHGAPLRLIAPAHYGYKSAKHIKSVALVKGVTGFRNPRLFFLIHPRGRVAQEERGRGLPGWLLRYVYRPLVGSTRRRFAAALAQYSKASLS